VQVDKDIAIGRFWSLPLFSEKPSRAPYHRIITSFNLFIASIFALIVTELSVRGKNRMAFESPDTYGYLNIVIDFSIAVAYENIAEYYWHRLLHSKPLYARFHKMHHQYKSPEPWDDMYIHPLEAALYYCILYAPPFLFRCHIIAFIAYMIVMGLCGIVDHSGIHFSVPGFYDSSDHDRHHSHFEVNYSFPFPYLDIIHGTYLGEFWGMKFKPRRRRDRDAGQFIGEKLKESEE
jgi:sterol desaturase/sphingolipid hydroxylase (fatty acid hydroxylase superfamily)